jgi:hypothetical protein
VTFHFVAHLSLADKSTKQSTIIFPHKKTPNQWNEQGGVNRPTTDCYYYEPGTVCHQLIITETSAGVKMPKDSIRPVSMKSFVS